MKIIVESTKVNTRSGVSKKTGNPWTMHEQEAFLHGDRIRGTVRLTLGDDGEPHSPGEYDIDFERSLSIGGFGSIEFRPVLVSVAAKSNSTQFPKAAVG